MPYPDKMRSLARRDPIVVAVEQYMRQRRISQAALARATGISVEMIYRYLNGYADPGIYRVRRMVEVLGFTLEVHGPDRSRLAWETPSHLSPNGSSPPGASGSGSTESEP